MADLYTPRLHRRVVRPPGNTRSASIYEQLRSALLSGQYLPGTWLREEQLAAEYAASRTPVREALRRLESDGLVEIVPRRGVLVVDLALEDLDEVYDIRSALETLAATRSIGRISSSELSAARAILDVARAATERGDVPGAVAANDHFHQVVYRASHSPRLWAQIAGLGDVVQRYRFASLSVPHRAAAVVSEHAALLQAIEQGDEHHVRQLMAEHIEHARMAAIRAQLDRARARRAAANAG